jgi:uncharacterized membrane protein
LHYSKPLQTIVVLAVAGLGISGYLVWYDLMTRSGTCPLTGFFGCTAILTSAYSRIFGVPTALFGFIWFLVVVLFAALVARDAGRLKFLLVWSLLGFVGVIGLVYIELFLIGAICPLCTFAHVLGILVLALTAIMWNKRS